jgi:hypothetical protein
MNEGSFTATSPTTRNVPGGDRWLLYETAVDPAPRSPRSPLAAPANSCWNLVLLA